MKQFTATTVLRASSDCVVRDISGEIMLLNLRNGTYYGLDATGAEIWKLLTQTASVGSIVQHLHDTTGESVARIDADMHIFLKELCAHELVDMCDDEGT